MTVNELIALLQIHQEDAGDCEIRVAVTDAAGQVKRYALTENSITSDDSENVFYIEVGSAVQKQPEGKYCPACAVYDDGTRIFPRATHRCSPPSPVVPPAQETAKVIAEAEQLLQAITPGEWYVADRADAVLSKRPSDAIRRVATVDYGVLGDLKFIAAAPRLLRQLLAALGRPAPSDQNE